MKKHSVKNRNRRIRQKYQPPRSVASDTYTNPPAFLGAASNLISSGTWIRSGLASNTDLLTTLYRESWLAKRIIDMPAEDMTRAWYSLTSSASPEELMALRRLESRHAIRSEITSAIRWARLYGGSLAVIVIRGEEDLLDQPLREDSLYPGCFQGLLVVDRAQGIAPSSRIWTIRISVSRSIMISTRISANTPSSASIIPGSSVSSDASSRSRR